MISLSIKVPGLDFMVGAAFQATFEGDSLFFSNQKIGESENCDILFRGSYGLKAEFGWDSDDCFYCDDVDFDDALVEISTIEQSMCIDIDPGTRKLFKKIKADVVLITVNNEIEIFISKNENKIKHDITSPLGNEVLLITDKAKNRLIKFINHRDSGLTHKKKEKTEAHKGQSTKVLDPEDFVDVKINLPQIHSEQENKVSEEASEPEPRKETYNDVAWWTRSEAGWDEDVVPAIIDSEDPYNDGDYNEIDDLPEREASDDLDNTYDDEFENDEPYESYDTSISSEMRETEFKIEYEKKWKLLKPNKIVFKMPNSVSRGMSLITIPQFPGCHVVPEKFLFNYETADEVVFYATPFRIGKCDDLLFEFWCNGSELGTKNLEQPISIKMPTLFRAIASIFLTCFIIILLLIFTILNIISFNCVVISMGSLIILLALYFGLNSGNKIIIETSKIMEEQD